MRGEVLGSIGLAFLVYTVITTIQKVEASFNFVWRVERPRSFAPPLHRIFERHDPRAHPAGGRAWASWARAEHSPFAQWLQRRRAAGMGLAALRPDRAVRDRHRRLHLHVLRSFPTRACNFAPALIGGVTAGVMWALVGKVFTAFIVYSSQMVAVYTGFAIVLTTLIWVYLSWLILLIGAQLAFYVQFPQYLRHGQRDHRTHRQRSGTGRPDRSCI